MDDAYLVLLRLVHIIAGVIWLGGGFTMLFIVYPTVNALETPEARNRFWLKFYNVSRWNTLLMAVAIGTTLAGILLYVKVSDTFDADWMKNRGNQVLSLGAVAGILAFGHGGAVMGRISEAFTEQLKTTFAKGDVSDDDHTTLLEGADKVKTHAHISFGLMIIAIVCMASARYI